MAKIEGFSRYRSRWVEAVELTDEARGRRSRERERGREGAREG
jgi:hypothetical protein